jgi:hypothetical protein
LPILKIIEVPSWIVWVLRNRPEIPVVHIVRNPGGFLNSIITRWHSQQASLEPAWRFNRDLLARIAAQESVWASRFGDVEAMSMQETELWMWRYSSETIHRAGAGNPRYQLVIYEEFATNPVAISRSLYQSLNLDWDETIERAIRGMSGESRAIASAWRDRLDAEQIALVKRILSDSLIRHWWDEGSQPHPCENLRERGA